MSCLSQHKTKEELSDWLMDNASDNETTGFLDMLAGDIWDMMTAETELKEKTAKHLGMAETLHDAVVEENKKLKEENKKQKKEHIQKIMKTNRIGTELYREVKYALGYGELDEPDRKVMYEEIKKLKEENKKLQEEFDDKEHWGNTMVDYMDYGDHWCHFDRWFGENIDEDDKKQEWVKTWMENTEYEEEVVQDINAKNVKIPTEEECQKNFGVSREEFIMLAKQSDCAY